MRAEERGADPDSRAIDVSGDGGRPPLIDDWAPRLILAGGTKYAAVASAIERGIRDGYLPAGMKLPPQRDIAEYFNVTIATVTKAISVAMRKGLVIARAGSGTFIAEPPVREPVFDEAAETPNQDLSLNAPPVDIVMDILHENLEEIAAEPGTPRLFDYEPVPGGLAHRLAGCRWVSLRGLDVSPGNVLVTQGAHEGLLACLAALTQPGDVVLCERLNYTGLRRIGQLLRIHLVGVEVDEHGLCVDQLPELIRRHAPKAIVCTPVTHNPTTVTLSADRRPGLVEIARKTGTPIIEDDIYGLFVGEKHPPLASLWPEGVLLVTSLSKTIASGLRIGYIVAPPGMVPRLTDAMFMLGWTAPLMHMSFATRLIESGRAERCIHLHREEAGRRTQLARRILGKSLQTAVDTPTYHVWVDTGATRLEDITAELYRQGILVSPASHFLIGDGPVPGALRLSLGRVADHKELELPLRLIAHRLSVSRPSALGSIV